MNSKIIQAQTEMLLKKDRLTVMDVYLLYGRCKKLGINIDNEVATKGTENAKEIYNELKRREIKKTNK